MFCSTAHRSFFYRIVLSAAGVCCGVLSAGPAPAGDYVWFEGESPSQNPLNAVVTSVQHSEYLSGKQWLVLDIPAAEVAKKVPAEGALIGYTFDVKTAGQYEVWNRIGMDAVRSAFDWRVDNTAWQTIPLDAPYTDLMDPAVFNELSWVKLGTAELAAGKHTLQIRVLPALEEKKKDAKGQEAAAQKPRRLVYAADCFCLSMGEFRPNGNHKPGEEWMTADDKKAAQQTFEMPRGDKAGERVTLDLSGLWQICRYDEWAPANRSGPDKVLPDAAKMFWSAIPVPSDKYKSRPDLTLAHRLVYRTRVNVPAELKGHGFFLHFPSNNMISSIFVNGQFCGWTKAMLAPWDCDITAAVKAGESNEIAVVIKDNYYALSPEKGKTTFGRLGLTTYNSLKQWMGSCMDFPIQSNAGHPAGILEKPSLVACGGVYTADVFAKPSVKKKELGLEITLKNPGSAPAQAVVDVAVEPLAGGPSEKTFAAQKVTVGAGQEAVVTITEPWANPKLWWPDDPQQYNVVTKVSVEGKPADLCQTKFGFREWEWNSSQFKLNGIPWHGRACGISSGTTADEKLKLWRANHQTTFRQWGNSFCGMSRPEALDWADRVGMPLRMTGILEGMGCNYWGGIVDPVLFNNWLIHMEQWTKAFRNHPALYIWSLENEVTYVNSRNLGASKKVEPMIAYVAKRVMELDPTRPVMTDGGRCGIDENMPVNGCHYEEAKWREYPDEAYTLAIAYKSHLAFGTVGGLPIPWRLIPDRPIVMGESFYLRGWKPADFALFGGEECFGGWASSRSGAGLFAKILSEGDRWQGLGTFDLALSDADVTPFFNSWSPVIVLCREWNWTFNSGAKVARTLKVLNDTRYSSPIEMGWELRVAGKAVAGEKKSYTVPPGEGQEVPITFTVPTVKDRTSAEFILTCNRDGQEVFRDVKKVSLIDADSAPKPALKPGELAVLDPMGAVKGRLTKRGIAFTEIKNEDPIPPTAKVVIVGPDAWDVRNATDMKWKGVAARGGRVIVLDQANPLRFGAIPADLEPTSYQGRIAFSENLKHPVFQGLEQSDFFTWSDDNIVYRNVYRKGSRGARSLAFCDEELGYTCLSESEVNEGLMILCQMAVGSKLATNPVAQRLFDNLLNYCATYQPLRRTTAVAMADPLRSKLLTEIGLSYATADDPLKAIQSGQAQIVVADATPATLHALAASDATAKFTAQGGWLVLWGLTPEGLADFNKLVGVDHVLRPFEMERVTMAMPRDPLAVGITDRDVLMESGETIFVWAGTKYPITDEFNYLVDLDDIAPFCEFPGAKAGDVAAARKMAAHWPRNVVNGFTSNDAWILTYYMETAQPKLAMKLPRPEEITGLDIVLMKEYAAATKLKLYFDDDPQPLILPVTPNNERQSLAINPPRKASSVVIELADYNFNKPDQSITGIDNLWLHVQRSEAWRAKVKPLLTSGGLVRYPQGAGGIVLCQLVIPEHEALPVNGLKRRNIVATLLKNMGAVFSGGKVVVPGSGLAYTPVLLNEPCNQFLTKDRGWFSDERRDLGHFPVGEQSLAGVKYEIRDFKTSPLPCAISLTGNSTKTALPDAVRNIPVKQKADALFFLHAWKKTANWQPPQKGDRTPPVIWKYVVKYADGRTAEALVRYNDGVGSWVQKEAADLPNASVAWAAPFPADKSGEQAVVYQMQWSNPRPDVEIASFDVAYDPDVKNKYGVPVVLAITAGKEAK